MATLANIRTKIRRLTRSPSTQQITDAIINEYINNFVLYDLPEHLRLFTLRTTLKFYTEPNIASYSTNTIGATHPLYDFNNKYITTDRPAYVAGYPIRFSQSTEEFYNIYPFINTIATIGTGDGVTTAFAGTLPSVPVLPNHVLFTSIDVANDGIVLTDIPYVDAATGIPTTLGDLVVPNNDATASVGAIDYVNGTYTFTFPDAPALNELVRSQTVPYQASRPQTLFYFDNTFTFRPVPDQVYEVRMDVYKQPTSLSNDADNPELKQWWEYIAYGAAIKIFQDRMDMDSVAMVMPEFKNQEKLVLRRTIVQQTKERTSTIYSDQTANRYGPWGWGGGQF